MFPGRQLKLTVNEECIPENFQLQSALPTAAIGVAVGLVYSQYPGIPSCFRRLYLQSVLSRQFFFFRRLQPTVESPPLLWGFSPLIPGSGRIIFTKIQYFCCKQDSIDNRYRSQIRGKPLQGASELRGSDFLSSPGKTQGKRCGNH